MSRLTKTSRALALLLLGSLAAPVHADWQLDNEQSYLNFISIKKVNVAEIFHITKLQGELSDAGELRIDLDLDSIKTDIDIRDERMRKYLFETDKFKMATLTASIPKTVQDALNKSNIVQASITGTLDFHGFKKEIIAEVSIMSDGESVMVATRQPIILRAETFGLSAGIDKLQELAGLPNIGHTVPVTFSLVLTQTQ